MRFAAAGTEGVGNVSGWLTTIVTRACLNLLRARAARPEQPAGMHVPDPIAVHADDAAPDLEQEALLAESIGLALMVVLDALTLAERVAFVLHDVFGVPFSVIGELVGRSEQAARQLASRARRQVREAGPSTPDVGLPQQRAIVDAFFTAARAGDFDRLLELLDPDVVIRADGGPARRLGRHARRGADRPGDDRDGQPASRLHPGAVNGVAGMLITVRGRPVSLIAVTVTGSRITAMDGITDLDRLARLGLAARSPGSRD